MTDTIESCQRRIVELIQSTQQENDNIPDVAAVSQELALLYTKMGDLLLAGKDIDNASKCFEAALQLDPTPWLEHDNLRRTKAFLIEMSVRSPRDIALLSQLGELHYKLREFDQALECFRKVLGIEPDNLNSLYWIAGIQQLMGDRKAAEESYRHATKLQPLFKVPANKTPAEFSALVIFSPLRGNTPIDGLMEKAHYDVNIFVLLPDAGYDIEKLRHGGQIAVNVVSDADDSGFLLPQVAKLVDQLGMPVINHPSKIQKTTRDGIARLLHGIPDCRVAQVVRHVAGEVLPEKAPVPLPLLARTAGEHGGDNFEKIDNLYALHCFIKLHPGADHFLMEYIDYQSPDGHFRKYRFIFIDGQIMPYHLAIGNYWKVHHATTDMDKNEAMQAEEKAFLENPAAFFLPKHFEAMSAIHRALDLEYFGIDCGIDKAGNLVVFEANASMLVHWHNEAFPYKTPFVRNIKQAFDAMLKKRVA